MEATGINIGYLLVQVLCIGSFLLLVGGAAVLLAMYMGRVLRKTENEAQGDLLMTAVVGPDGVLVPAELLAGSKQVEIRQQYGRLLLVPLAESPEGKEDDTP
jgi:hypothetical protein